MQTDQVQVLIVGAGPTGLAAAAALARLGVRVRIIDRAKARSDKSKALGVQAGTLECLASALDPGLSEEMVRSGFPTYEAWIHLDDATPIRVDLRSIPSRHNYILILEQSETERILEEYLERHAIRVERQTELLTLEPRDSSVEARVRAPGGEQSVIADFVIGCDGAHSTVRHQMGFSFKGGAYDGDFILGDVTLSWPWPYDSIQTFVSERGVIASFPLKGERKYRLIFIPRQAGPQAAGAEIGLDEFRSIASSLSQGRISISEASWLTRFRVHHRMVDRFQKGRVFLAGDAAHIHSPAGGQGMNTGIQDALNLAFKLAACFAGKRDLSSLRDYERERMPVARGVLRGTDLVFKLALLPENRLVSALRSALIPRVVGSRWVQRRVAAAISEMAIASREIENYR